ncbi:lipid A deacylase LpxR family protein [Flavobacterium undicola]|uniref:lipid A deacylase LpxR family protein n=1 Tax=Flavobacterium undicola TaxID=1932779 RepID=UPI001377F36E|nr:lipid A deacylase LpxR family protein [Flavobacterium undicola]MBA0882708.1 lipid A deacylase LpxR family protein [Flavobacterium undicola]
MQSKTVLFVYLLLLFSVTLSSQNSSVEIGIVTDNDLYTSSKNDQYYTNGLEVFYRYLSKKNKPQLVKKINQIRLGQYIYSPRSIYKNQEEMFDRPFAGYLFGEFGNTNFYTNQAVLKKYVQIGYVGPNSFANEVQSETHRLFHYKAFEEWDYQIKNTLGLQTYAMFAKPFFSGIKSRRIDFQWQSEVKLGTIFTSLSTGFVTRIGIKRLVLLSDSNSYGGSLKADVSPLESEFYFYMTPSFNYQIYDATIQGSLFNDNSPVTFDITPFRFNGEAGLRYRINNLNLSYAFVYRGKELKSDRNIGYFYGSVAVSYLFR